jgi:hypothetical protein
LNQSKELSPDAIESSSDFRAAKLGSALWGEGESSLVDADAEARRGDRPAAGDANVLAQRGEQRTGVSNTVDEDRDEEAPDNEDSPLARVSGDCTLTRATGGIWPVPQTKVAETPSPTLLETRSNWGGEGGQVDVPILSSISDIMVQSNEAFN